MQNACGRTHRGEQSFQRGHINKKYTFFPPILQIPGAINSFKIGVIHAIGGPKKLFLAWFYIHAFLKIMLPNKGGKQIFKKKWQKSGRKGFAKHEMHKESIKLHTKYKKMQVLCIPSLLQKGLGGENSTGVEPQAVFEGGKKRTHSETNEQQSKKSEQ